MNEANLKELRALVADTGKQTGQNKERYLSGELDNGFAMKCAIAAFELAKAKAIEEAGKTKLPRGYQWSESNQIKFRFGATRTAERIGKL